MIAIYRGEPVRLIRIAGRRAYIVWRGMIKRVNARELEDARTEDEGLRTEGSAVAT